MPTRCDTQNRGCGSHDSDLNMTNLGSLGIMKHAKSKRAEENEAKER